MKMYSKIQIIDFNVKFKDFLFSCDCKKKYIEITFEKIYIKITKEWSGFKDWLAKFRGKVTIEFK